MNEQQIDKTMDLAKIDNSKRFFSQASLADSANGYHVMLDGRVLSLNQGQTALEIASLKLAEAIKLEWQHSQRKISLKAMPMTALALRGA